MPGPGERSGISNQGGWAPDCFEAASGILSPRGSVRRGRLKAALVADRTGRAAYPAWPYPQDAGAVLDSWRSGLGRPGAV